MSEAAVGLLTEAPAVMARALPLTREMSLDEAFRCAARECHAHIAGNAAPVVENRDAEGLHQLRVGLRRLTIALADFAPGATDLRTRAKAFFDATGPARDIDMFLTELFEPVVAELEPVEGFAILRRRAEQMRARAWDAAAAEVASPDFATFLGEVAAARRPVDQPEAALATQAAAVLDKHLMRVAKRGRGFKTLSNEGIHGLRIALKKLRYAADFHAALYKEKAARRYLKQLKTLQDVLGRINDAAQVRGFLGRLMMEEAASAQVQADLSYAAGQITGWNQAAARDLRSKAREHWRAFKQAEPFWRD